MTKIKRKNSETDSPIDIYDFSATFAITVEILVIPAVCMKIYAHLYCITCSPSSINPELNRLGYNLGGSIPVIGFFSAIVISCFVAYILKIRETLWRTLLTIILTSSVLIGAFMVSMYLQDWR